ncbi:unnamed protein product [Parnassius apollo]|uniref:(apollo) hypothetical protein n=1 Tax=Parnassius apollo TaxID=110799 RepID=A0A8S3WZR4_PARAO|nr:unnamed protein product [Parnassius apollo]
MSIEVLCGLVRGCSVKAAWEMTAARSHRPGGATNTRDMLLVITCILAAATAAPTVPATYDERQDGEFNVRADVQNVVLIVAIPQKLSFPNSLLDGLVKRSKQRNNEDAQDRADIQVMEAFVEPNTPYQVEIGPGSERSSGGGGRAAEVVIAGRRRLETEPAERDEYKLLGATEQCGPDRERDPVTLSCRARVKEIEATPEKTPEVVPVSS